MRLLAGIVGVTLLSAAVPASAETIRFAILRDGTQIGTHVIEISRTGPETSVKIATDLEVKVLFVTAYQLKHTATERWVDGRLVALKSSTNNNGTRHSVAVNETSSGVEIKADGKAANADKSLMPGSLWNPELLRRSVMLDSQEGTIRQLSVVDHGPAQVTVKGRVVKARRYTLKSKWEQDVWYDEQSRLIHAQLIASDGSIISYQLL